jgi:hypothetical protein
MHGERSKKRHYNRLLLQEKNPTSLTETHSGSCLQEARAGPAGCLGHSGSCRRRPQAEAGAGRLGRVDCRGATTGDA